MQRIRNNGKLSNAIAICDVSGSMRFYCFPDGTTPCDTAVGLSLIIAEIAAPPYDGVFIIFSQNPVLIRAGGANDTRSLPDRVSSIKGIDWGMTTVLAVFERLLLPTAIERAIAPEGMIRCIFAFSDMQFDAASNPSAPAWEIHLERLRRLYADAGYELPELVFRNLDAGLLGVSGAGVPKTAVQDQKGVVMVTGYSQALLKMFLDDGQFGGAETETETGKGAKGAKQATLVEVKGEDDFLAVKTETKQMESMTMLRRPISHEDYGILKVVD